MSCTACASCACRPAPCCLASRMCPSASCTAHGVGSSTCRSSPGHQCTSWCPGPPAARPTPAAPAALQVPQRQPREGQEPQQEPCEEQVTGPLACGQLSMTVACSSACLAGLLASAAGHLKALPLEYRAAAEAARPLDTAISIITALVQAPQAGNLHWDDSWRGSLGSLGLCMHQEHSLVQWCAIPLVLRHAVLHDCEHVAKLAVHVAGFVSFT
jgi:hypothetical protein